MVRKTKRHNNNKNKTLKGGKHYNEIDAICTENVDWRKKQIIAKIKSQLRQLANSNPNKYLNIYNGYFAGDKCSILKNMFKSWNEDQWTVDKTQRSDLFTKLKSTYFVFGKSKIPAYAIQYYPSHHIDQFRLPKAEIVLGKSSELQNIVNKKLYKNAISSNIEHIKRPIYFAKNKTPKIDENYDTDINQYELDFIKSIMSDCDEECINTVHINLNTGTTTADVMLRKNYKQFLLSKATNNPDVKTYLNEFMRDTHLLSNDDTRDYELQLAKIYLELSDKKYQDDNDENTKDLTNYALQSGLDKYLGGKKRRYSSKLHRK